jgi:hypothetical protein
MLALKTSSILLSSAASSIPCDDDDADAKTTTEGEGGQGGPGGGGRHRPIPRVVQTQPQGHQGRALRGTLHPRPYALSPEP